MNESSKYWKLVRIDAAEAGSGYKLQLLPPARDFFGEAFPESIDRTAIPDDGVQNQLFHLLWKNTVVQEDRAGTELCLRCYVSYPILQSCLKRARLFGLGNGFTYRDLLPFVLNDDGKIVQGEFVPFSIDILRSFSPEQKCSLAGWVDLRVRRNPELNRFLLECGLNFSSDWALLNRANPRQLGGIDRDLVEVFHATYRRDRPQQHRQGIRQKCLDPTDKQLQEMMRCLRERQVLIHSTHSLLNQLKRIAQACRQEDIWGRRGSPMAESLETTDPDTGETKLRDIPDYTSASDPDADQRSQLQRFCDEQLLTNLDQGIRQAVGDRIRSLEQRPRYTHLAHQVKPALRLLYFEGKSQAQIASLLGMTNQSQVSRILNPRELLVSIRQRTMESLLHCILEKVRELNIVDFPVSPDYFSNLMQQLDAFVDEQVFQAAAAEINAGRNRSMESVFAQRLRQILNEQAMSSAA
ncbi:hypothetical protein [Phormidesmis priestleyi]